MMSGATLLRSACVGLLLAALTAGAMAIGSPDVLFVPGRPRYRYVLMRDPDGKVTGFAQRREAWDLVWTRIAAPKPGG